MVQRAFISSVAVPKYEILDARLLSVGFEGMELCTKECLDVLGTCTELVRHEK